MLLAAAEICGIPVALLFFAACLLIAQHERQNPTFTSITWNGDIYSPLSIPAMQEFFRFFFCNERSCVLDSYTPVQQVFRRGNPSITSMPAVQSVYWHEVPITVTLSYSVRNDGRTAVTLFFAAPSAMRFDKTCAEFFHKEAEAEHDLAFESLRSRLEIMDRQNQTFQGSHSAADDDDLEDDDVDDDDFDDDDTEEEPDPSPSVSGAANDYETLGLKIGATWEQVQAAYRDACKKYHPDMLSGQKVPPHLIELAVAKFKEITNAYQRLKRILN
ncbi:MAG: J domain-containing protein [Phycisphaerae bacterium]